MNTLGERLTYLREINDLNRAQVMKELDIHNLGRFEDNKRKPGVDIIITLAEYYGVSIDWLLTGKGDTPQKESTFLDQQSKEKLERYTKYAMAIGEHITYVREENNLSLEDFAARINTTADKLEEYETGRVPVPAYILYTISKTFNILPAFLLDPDEVVVAEYEAIEDYVETNAKSSNLTNNIIHFFNKLPRSEQEDIAEFIMIKYNKLSKKVQSSNLTNGEDEEAAARELA